MASDCCGCSQNVQALRAEQRRVLRIVLVINALTFLLMLAASLYSGSTSLLSGSLDNLGDALTYGLSLAVIGRSAQAQARVALVKAALILSAALAVAVQIGWHLAHPVVPILNAMSVAAVVNLAANALCLYFLTPYRHGDINMASVWECSRNDVIEGVAVLIAAAGVGFFHSGWPDLVIAAGLLLVFLRSAARVFLAAFTALRTGGRPGRGA
jgi:Co/Zn/Cd efflux system component